MRNRKFRNRQLQDNYPTPGVPADDAWAAMNKMLDTSQPPQSPGKHRTPRGWRLFWYMASLVVLVPALLWLLYNRESSTEVSKSKAQVIQTKKETGQQQSTSTASGNDAGASGKQDSNYGNVTINDKALKSVPPGNTNSPADAGGETLAPANGSISAGKSNRQNIAGSKDIPATVKRISKLPGDKKKNNRGVLHEGRRNTVADFTGDADSNGTTIGPGPGIANPGQANDIFEKGIHKALLNTGANQGDTDLVNNMGNIGAPDVAGIASSLAQFIISTTRLELDSSFLQKLNKQTMDMDSSKKEKMKTTGKLKTTNKKTTGLDYGFQWEVPVPVQGTANYSKSTNGKANAFNLLLPQLWMGKGIGHRSKLFVVFNFKEQYFIKNKQLTPEVMFAAPRDTGVNTTSLYKIGGFGGTIAWGYEINKHWGTSLGINYVLNRTALLDKQSRNFYTGNITGDSLYKIDRYSADWQYINKSMLAARLELYYIFKKFNAGASATLPLNTIPVYDKKIRPLNAQLFIRWNVKK